MSAEPPPEPEEPTRFFWLPDVVVSGEGAWDYGPVLSKSRIVGLEMA